MTRDENSFLSMTKPIKHRRLIKIKQSIEIFKRGIHKAFINLCLVLKILRHEKYTEVDTIEAERFTLPDSFYEKSGVLAFSVQVNKFVIETVHYDIIKRRNGNILEDNTTSGLVVKYSGFIKDIWFKGKRLEESPIFYPVLAPIKGNIKDKTNFKASNTAILDLTEVRNSYKYSWVLPDSLIEYKKMRKAEKEALDNDGLNHVSRVSKDFFSTKFNISDYFVVQKDGVTNK